LYVSTWISEMLGKEMHKNCAKRKFLWETAVNGFRGKTIKNAHLLAPSKKLIPIALIMSDSKKKLMGAEEAIIAVAFPATGMDGSERLFNFSDFFFLSLERAGRQASRVRK